MNSSRDIQEQEINLHQFLLILRRRFPYLAVVLFIVIISSSLYTWRQIPLYQGRVLLSFTPNSEAPVDFTATARIANISDFVDTQKQIITSRAVIRRVFAALNMPETGEDEQVDFIGQFCRNISLEPVRNTHVMRMSVLDPDPEKAALLTNTLTRIYIAYDLERRRSASTSSFAWLSKEVAVLKAAITKSEMALLQYKQEEEFSSLEKRQATLDEKIDELNDNYSKAVLLGLEKKAVLEEVQGTGVIPVELDSPQVSTLKEQYAQISFKIDEISTKYKTTHPKHITLTTQLANIKKRLSAEAQKTIEALKVEERILRKKKENLSGHLTTLQKKALRLSELAVQYGVLKREAESNKQMYDVLLERLKETDIGSSIISDIIHVIDKAEVPKRPVRPNKRRNMLLAMVLGVFLGTGVCFLVEYFDSSIKNRSDAELLLNLPVIGEIPTEKPKMTAKDVRISVADRAYYDLKLHLTFHKKEHILNTLLVTSALPDEGKTTSVASLGTAFALAGTKTLLIDADIMKPGLHKHFSMENDRGLSNFLLGSEDPVGLIRETAIENLHLLPSGLIPPNPEELLASGKINEFADAAKKDFELVIIDSPPLSATLGVAHLGASVDGAILVVRAGSTASAAVKEAADVFMQGKVNVLGSVLVGVKMRDNDYYGGNYGG